MDEELVPIVNALNQTSERRVGTWDEVKAKKRYRQGPTINNFNAGALLASWRSR